MRNKKTLIGATLLIAVLTFSVFAQDAKLPQDVTIKDAAVNLVDSAAKAVDAVKALPKVNAEDPGEILRYILIAFEKSHWAWFVGLLLMLATFLVNKVLRQKIPKKVLPWLAIGLATAVNIAMSFASGLPWTTALGNGLTMGLAAGGGWSAVGKLLLTKKKEEEAEEDKIDDEFARASTEKIEAQSEDTKEEDKK